MWELDYKEVWAPKNWCFQTVVLEKTPESPLDCKEIKPSNPKENPPWIFIGRADAEAEAPILGPPDVKSRLTEKDPDAGKDWKQKEKGTSEGEVVGWHHWLNGHEFEQTLGEMFVYTRSIKICASRFDELLESIVYLLVVVEAFSLKKSLRCLRSGSRLARDQVNTADEAKFHSPIFQLLKCWLCNAQWGVFMEKSWAHYIDRYWLQALQFSVHLIDLPSLLLRCNGFARIQKAIVDQTSDRPPDSDHDLFWVQVWL